jgi:protein-L-isoaspartate(D-aspartate) O-methyltransferase
MTLTDAAALAQRLRPAVLDERVLAAIASIPRERFVRSEERERAYENVALPIACEQTISQPLVVARMLEAVSPQPEDRVLDVGTGSGYHAALLALLADQVWTVERHAGLSALAEQAIRAIGLDNVKFLVGDGAEGLAAEAPFDVINVAAATAARVAEALQQQLAVGGRLVAPVGGRRQHLVLIRRTPEGFVRQKREAVRFVPLIRGEPGAGIETGESDGQG